MSITFPKTWVANEKIVAEDVRDNLDAMQNKQSKLTVSDFTTDPFIDTHHIMGNRYQPTGNISVNVSGVFGGRNSGSLLQNFSYCSRWISNRTGSTTDPQVVYIPFSNITFDIVRPATIVFQWAMISQSIIDGDGVDGKTIIRPALLEKSETNLSIPHVVSEQLNANVDVLINGTHTTNGVVIFDRSSPKQGYSIGLTGESTAGKCMNVSWSVSLECFYM